LDYLLEEEDKGQDFYADSAYTGEDQEKIIDKLISHYCTSNYRT